MGYVGSSFRMHDIVVHSKLAAFICNYEILMRKLRTEIEKEKEKRKFRENFRTFAFFKFLQMDGT